MGDNPHQQYLIWQCDDPGCALRFPASVSAVELAAGRCPVCGAPATIASRPLRNPTRPRELNRSGGLPRLELFLDNIRSTYNIGSIIRTADGAGVKTIHLCGISATPDHPKVAKTALGAVDSLKWTHSRNGVTAAKALINDGFTLWGLEETPEAEPLLSVSQSDLPPKLILVIGNEVVGIDPDILRLCTRVLSLPMKGIKESLNVTVACGIAVYHLLHGHL